MPNRTKYIQHAKLRGEWAELRFMLRASELGLILAKPWEDNAPLHSRDSNCILPQQSGSYQGMPLGMPRQCRTINSPSGAGSCWQDQT